MCLTVGVHDSLPDWWKEHEIDELGIELATPLSGDRVGGVLGAACVAVATTVRDRVEGVGDGDDARREGDAAAPQAARVSAAVPAFVVREDALRELGVKAAERGEDLGSAPRVRGDRATGFGGEGFLFVDDVEERLVDLSDVVKERDPLDGLALAAVESRCVGDDEGVRRDAAHVRAGLRVVRVDGVEECLERGAGETLGGSPGAELADDDCARSGAGGKCDERLHMRGLRRKKRTARMARMREGPREACVSRGPGEK